MRRGFKLKNLFAFTLIAALLIPYGIAFLRKQETVNWYELSGMEIESSLQQFDPELLVLDSGSFAGSRRTAFFDNNLLIITDCNDHLRIFAQLRRTISDKIREAGWKIDDSGGTNDSHWIRIRKEGSICVIQIWISGLDPLQALRLEDRGKSGFSVRTALNGFLVN